MSTNLISWNDDFLIGITELDDEHRDLIEQFNAYTKALNEEQGLAEIRKILGNLYARLEMHFALEERVMRAFEYEDFQDHKSEHNTLLNEYSDFIEKFREDPELQYEEMVSNRIRHWIVHHILESDQKMARMIHYMTTEEREKLGNFFDKPVQSPSE